MVDAGGKQQSVLSDMTGGRKKLRGAKVSRSPLGWSNTCHDPVKTIAAHQAYTIAWLIYGGCMFIARILLPPLLRIDRSTVLEALDYKLGVQSRSDTDTPATASAV
jgi:hypothetical protein